MISEGILPTVSKPVTVGFVGGSLAVKRKAANCCSKDRLFSSNTSGEIAEGDRRDEKTPGPNRSTTPRSTAAGHRAGPWIAACRPSGALLRVSLGHAADQRESTSPPYIEPVAHRRLDDEHRHVAAAQTPLLYGHRRQRQDVRRPHVGELTQQLVCDRQPHAASVVRRPANTTPGC